MSTRPGQPVHLRPVSIALVFIGGTLGTAAREALTLAVPSLTRFPVAVFCANVLGAFLLGVLLEDLVRRGPDSGRRQRLRLLAGTGFLGGFTTYSAFATDAAALIGGSAPGTGIGYVLATLVVGSIASWAGIAVAARRRQRNGTQRRGLAS